MTEDERSELQDDELQDSEIEGEEARELPDREVMSIIRGGPIIYPVPLPPTPIDTVDTA